MLLVTGSSLPHEAMVPTVGQLQRLTTWPLCDLDSAFLGLGLDTFPLFFTRFTICHKTEVMKNTLNPVWQTFSIPVRALCNGDYDR